MWTPDLKKRGEMSRVLAQMRLIFILYLAVFEIKVLFCAPLGCIHIETVRPGFSLCTPLVYYNCNWVNKCAHVGRTRPKNVRPAAKMCAPGAECTVNFEHCLGFTFLGIGGLKLPYAMVTFIFQYSYGNTNLYTWRIEVELISL